MFGMSAERNEVERTPRIAQCGHAPEALRGASAALSLCGIALIKKCPQKTAGIQDLMIAITDEPRYMLRDPQQS